jgi:hypothetical protein
MDEPTPPAVEEDVLSYWDQHRYLLLVGIVIVISLVLTITSVAIYNLTGANQLDLSRPGYQSVSDQVEQTNTIDEYSASGPFNTQAGEEFLTIYDEQATKAKAIDAFNGDPLNPEVLEFGEPAAQ